ncbi:VapB-type antitoxin [Acidianus manzaensis]|uniref:VapB-type antitoxin n=1 Tax=Acidianus manzaensis TaxID=282676 RepID=A0A1W6K2M8_9CREN|nr:VapB-type antitoxin [Acidianus manzaensis]ARM76694.1 VapB-type antitoxin [Acidianus manzaensis]
MKTVTIKVKDEIFEIAEEMVKEGIASSRNEAFNIIMEIGLNEAKKRLEKKKKIDELVNKWLKEGLPKDLDLPTSEEVISERE